MPNADILVANHGTIATLRPLTDEAQLWLEEHVNTDFGCNPVYCEPRYVPPIIEGAQEAGFKIQVI